MTTNNSAMNTNDTESVPTETSESKTTVSPNNAANDQKPATCETSESKTTVSPNNAANDQKPATCETSESKTTVSPNNAANDQKPATCETSESKTTVSPNNAVNDQKLATCGEVKNAVKDIKEVLEQCQNETKEGLHEIKEFFRTEFQKCKNKTKEGLGGMKSQLKDDFFRSGEFNMFMTLKIVLMVVVVVYFCSCTHVSEVQPCELKRALDSIHLNYTFKPCKYDTIKEINSDLINWGMADVYLTPISAVVFILGICVFTHSENKRIRIIMWLVLVILAICPFIVSAVMYSKLQGNMKEHDDLDYGKLQSLLLKWLERHYKSDSMSNSDAISNGWNNLFIQYDCCAVREVLGTTNDFDNTPWCTTSGSCQDTASQIPRTCCNFVTQDDYQNASSNCHASVNAGTYRSNCMGRIRAMGVDDIDDCVVSTMSMSLLAMLLLQIFEAIIIISFVICDVVRYIRS